MRILVVEDEPDLAAAVAHGLRRDGYAVDVAGDGEGALDRLASAEYDLVCLDLNLPDMGLAPPRYAGPSAPIPRPPSVTSRPGCSCSTSTALDDAGGSRRGR